MKDRQLLANMPLRAAGGLYVRRKGRRDSLGDPLIEHHCYDNAKLIYN